MLSKTLKIQNRQILPLGNWLGGLALPGLQSRMRTRFVAMLEGALANYEKIRKDALEAIAEKNEDGSLKVVEDKGSKHYVIPDDKKAPFEADMKKLNETEAKVTGPDALSVFTVIRDIVLNYQGTIDGTLATNYNLWCETFEEWNKK